MIDSDKSWHIPVPRAERADHGMTSLSEETIMIRRVALATMVLALLGGVAFARYIQWKPAEKPPVLLPLAVALADAEIEKHEGRFYCIGATLAKTFSAGDWELHYSSSTGKQLWVSVGSDRSVRVSETGFEY
jgi:hypothetical protein